MRRWWYIKRRMLKIRGREEEGNLEVEKEEEKEEGG